MFNVAYNSDMNGVEMLFGEWKIKVFGEARTIGSQEQLVRIVKESFLSIEESRLVCPL